MSPTQWPRAVLIERILIGLLWIAMLVVSDRYGAIRWLMIPAWVITIALFATVLWRRRRMDRASRTTTYGAGERREHERQLKGRDSWSVVADTGSVGA